MTFLRTGAEGPDILYCAYPGSRLRFRGPARSLDGAYVAALGGAATFGKGVARPWPAVLEATSGHKVVNLGAVGAGPEAALHDPGLLAACRGAAVVAIEVGGIGAVSSPFYRVHPRRNDRVVDTCPALRALFPGLELEGVAFAGHLLDRLRAQDPAAFRTLVKGLRRAWADRMLALLQRLAEGGAGPVVLVWLDAPPAGSRGTGLLTRAALAPLLPHVAAVVEGAQPPGPRPPLPDSAAHEAAALALAAVIPGLGGPAPGLHRAAG